MNNTNRVLLVLVIAVVMAAADATVVLLAFPDMTQLLHTDVSLSIWTILVYILITAVMTTQLGKLGDIYGRAKMFNLGLIVFTISSALCGLSPNILFLIGFRIVQGIGAAFLLANSGAIVADTFPKEKLGRAFGYIAAGWGGGSLMGIALGGLLTTLLGWRYIFYINVPIGIVAIILGLRYVKDKIVMKRHLDIFGIIFLGVALTLVSYDAIKFAAFGFSVLDVVLIAIGVLMVVALVWKERNAKDPIIDIKAFRSNRVLTFSLLAAMVVAMGTFSVQFMMTLYLQGIVGLTPLYAALLLSPGAIIGFLLSPRMGRLSDKVGARNLATAGIVAFGLAILVYMSVGLGYHPILFILASALSGFGVAMFYPANNAAVMAHASAGAYGSMNGLLRTLQSIGGLLSYILVVYIAASAVPRSIAFQVFVGTTTLLGGLTKSFVVGIQTALAGALILMIFAAFLSHARGREKGTKI